MAMAHQVIHVSEAEAAKDFATLLVRVRAGAEVVIEQSAQPVAVLKPVTARPGRCYLNPSRWQRRTALRQP